MTDFEAWYALKFGSGAYPLLMCREDGSWPGLRVGRFDYQGNELTVLTALRFPG